MKKRQRLCCCFATKILLLWLQLHLLLMKMAVVAFQRIVDCQRAIINNERTAGSQFSYQSCRHAPSNSFYYSQRSASHIRSKAFRQKKSKPWLQSTAAALVDRSRTGLFPCTSSFYLYTISSKATARIANRFNTNSNNSNKREEQESTVLQTPSCSSTANTDPSISAIVSIVQENKDPQNNNNNYEDAILLEIRQVVDILLNAGADSETVSEAGMSLKLYAEQIIIPRRTAAAKHLRKQYRPSEAAASTIDQTRTTSRYNNISTSTCTTPSSITQLLLFAGLSGKDCASIFVHTPSLAFRQHSVKGEEEEFNTSTGGETVPATLHRVFNVVLCGILQLRRYDARKVIRKCPGLLTVQGSREAFEIVDLFGRLGVSYTSLARDKSSIPLLLSRSPALMFRLVAFLSSDVIRMPIGRIGSLLRRSDCNELLDAVVPKLKNDDSNLDTKYQGMQATCKYLIEHVGIEDMAKVVSAYPGVLLLNTTTQICPLVGYLTCDTIKLDVENISKMIQTYPQLLMFGDNENISKIQKNVQYLVGSLEVPIESLRKIFRAFPSVITLDLETNMIPVVEFLRDSCGVINIGRFVTRFPPVLGYSVKDELLPKWQFLCKVCDFGYFEVVRFPAYFSYPLDKVIIPRYEYLKAKSIPFEVVTIDEVLRYGDADFARIVVGDKDGGDLFSRFLEERRKKRLKKKSANLTPSNKQIRF